MTTLFSVFEFCMLVTLLLGKRSLIAWEEIFIIMLIMLILVATSKNIVLAVIFGFQGIKSFVMLFKVQGSWIAIATMG